MEQALNIRKHWLDWFAPGSAVWLELEKSITPLKPENKEMETGDVSHLGYHEIQCAFCACFSRTMHQNAPTNQPKSAQSSCRFTADGQGQYGQHPSLHPWPPSKALGDSWGKGFTARGTSDFQSCRQCWPTGSTCWLWERCRGWLEGMSANNGQIFLVCSTVLRCSMYPITYGKKNIIFGFRSSCIWGYMGTMQCDLNYHSGDFRWDSTDHDQPWPLRLKHRPWQGLACRIGARIPQSESHWMLTKIGQGLAVSKVMLSAQISYQLFFGSVFFRHTTHTFAQILSDVYLRENHCGTLNLCAQPQPKPLWALLCLLPWQQSSVFAIPCFLIRCSDSASDTSNRLQPSDQSWMVLDSLMLLRELVGRVRVWVRICFSWFIGDIDIYIRFKILILNTACAKKCKPDSPLSNQLTNQSLWRKVSMRLNHCM